ncbi:MAG: AAA family ATPase [Blastocatellia bacterium]
MGAKRTITIGRELGSGGSYIGEAVARNLGLRYVDREVLHLAAETLGVRTSEVVAREGRLTSFWERLLGGIRYGPPDAPYTPPPLREISDKQLFEAETEIMKQISLKEDCVIVGRAAAHTLPKHPRTINLFFHAPVSYRIKRVIEIYKAPTPEAARSMIAESDLMRRRYFAQMTGRDWTDATNYDLCVDTSFLPLDDTAALIVEFINKREASGC